MRSLLEGFQGCASHATEEILQSEVPCDGEAKKDLTDATDTVSFAHGLEESARWGRAFSALLHRLR